MSTENWLHIYRQQIANLDDYEDFDELELSVSLVLNTRSGFVDVALSPEEQRILTQLDRELRDHQAAIAEFLPVANPPGPAHWWYYLHEGPQVQEQAPQPA
jgi:hypothetical protein